MLNPLHALKTGLARRARTWNWLLRTAGLGLMVLSLAARSTALFSCGVVLAAVSLFDMRLEEPQDKGIVRAVRRVMRLEQRWRAEPWSGGKRLEAAALLVLCAALGWSMLARDLGVGLLTFGGAALLGAWAAQKAQARWMAAEAAREEAEEAAEAGEARPEAEEEQEAFALGLDDEDMEALLRGDFLLPGEADGEDGEDETGNESEDEVPRPRYLH